MMSRDKLSQGIGEIWHGYYVFYSVVVLMLLEKNLRRLARLRSIVIGAEVVAVFLSVFAFDVELRLLPLALVIGAQVALNLFTWLRLQSPRSVSERELFLQLVLDVAALTVVLYFSGGASNPFTLLYLLFVSLTAAALPSANAIWGIVGISGLCYSGLLVLYVLVPNSHPHELFALHVVGMWSGFIASSCLIAFFAVSMNKVLRQNHQIVAEAREKMLRDERLVALGTLAAGAAHELGTPLATMQIISNELAHDFPHIPDIAAHSAMLTTQIGRCKDSLSVLSASAGQAHIEAGGSEALDTYLNRVIAEWHKTRPTANVSCQWSTHAAAPYILAEQTLSHALTNMLNNAADASIDHIQITGQWTDAQLTLEICDRGEGLTPSASANIGKTVFTTKSGAGLGLGLYLTYATINRLGGSVELFNRDAGGTCTRVVLPLTKLLVATSHHTHHEHVI